jgi:cation diffusion facilitator CzcD-associated flavoprotein CzcO
MLAECERRCNAGGLYFMTSFTDLNTDELANEKVAEFVRTKIRGKVKDPVVAELLTPRGYPFGAKRLCADNGGSECSRKAAREHRLVWRLPGLQTARSGINHEQL